MEERTLNEIISENLNQTVPNLSEKDKIKMVQTIENAIAHGIPVRDSLGINEDTMEFLYSQAHRLYSLQKFEHSGKLFQVLYLLYPNDPRYALGIAASFQKAKDYEKAIGWYLTLSIIDEESPLPFYYISDCFLKQDFLEATVEYLRQTVERCGENPNYLALKTKATLMMDPLKEQIKKEAALKPNKET